MKTKIELTENQLQKLFVACNCFLATNSTGPETEEEWMILKNIMRRALKEKFNFTCGK